MNEHSQLVDRDPEGLSIKDMLLRLDARLERFEPRIRTLEDEALVARTERKTLLSVFGSLRMTIVAAATIGPGIVGLILFLVH